jgi:hypothetical protein
LRGVGLGMGSRWHGDEKKGNYGDGESVKQFHCVASYIC